MRCQLPPQRLDDPQCARLPPPPLSPVYRQLLQEDKARGRWDASPAEGGPRPLKLTVRRDALLEDAYAALGGRGDALKGRLYVGATAHAVGRACVPALLPHASG